MMEYSPNTQLMVQAARLYYERELTQEQIAERLHLTRQKVSRLLSRARRTGIVEISIHDPSPSDQHLSLELKNRFNLHEVILTSGEGTGSQTGSGGQALRARIGMLAAEYVPSFLQEGATVGIGWGRTLYEFVNAVSPDHVGGGLAPQHGRTPLQLHLVPLIGGIGEMSSYFQVNSLVMHLAEALGGQYRFLHMPAFAGDQNAWNALVGTQEARSIMDLWKKLDVAIVGIGQVEFQQISSMFFADHISPQMLERLEAQGAVGDICGRFIDPFGNPLDAGTGVIGIGLQELRSTPEVIGIAGGVEKVRAIVGALRGGYLKTLISDTVTARAILAEPGK